MFTKLQPNLVAKQQLAAEAAAAAAKAAEAEAARAKITREGHAALMMAGKTEEQIRDKTKAQEEFLVRLLCHQICAAFLVKLVSRRRLMQLYSKRFVFEIHTGFTRIRTHHHHRRRRCHNHH